VSRHVAHQPVYLQSIAQPQLLDTLIGLRNRELFAASPERYTPQFSGLCTTGLALGVKAEADPSVFKIVDGKLYVFSSTGAREKVDKDPSLLAKAQQNSRSLR